MVKGGSLSSSNLDRVLGSDGLSAQQRRAFQREAPLLHSLAEKFCAEFIEPVCVEEITQILSEDQTAPSVQELLSNGSG